MSDEEKDEVGLDPALQARLLRKMEEEGKSESRRLLIYNAILVPITAYLTYSTFSLVGAGSKVDGFMVGFVAVGFLGLTLWINRNLVLRQFNLD